MKKRIISLLLTVALLTGMLPTGTLAADYISETDIAYPVEGGNIYFDMDGTITGADDTITVANIPSQISGVDVTVIGQSAFEDCTQLTSVTTPDTLTYIDWFAFRCCTSLTTITISAGVEDIGNCAFEDCFSLEGIWVDEANQTYSSDSFGVLFNKDKTQLMRCPGAFSGTYSIPSTVKMVDYTAFQYCSKLAQVVIPAGVRYMDIRTFDDCASLVGIWVNDENENYSSDESGILFNKDKSSLLRFPTAQSGVCNVPDSVTVIDEGAFACCTKLTEVVLPEGLQRINSNAFINCTSLTNVTIPDSVTYIGDYAFAGCESLTEINISANVTDIGPGAFCDCTALTGIWVNEANQFYSSDKSGVLFDKDKATLILCPYPYSGSYTIPNGVTSIGDRAFDSHHALTSVEFPASVTTIGSFAFYECSNLTSMYFLGDAPEVGYYGMRGNSNLTIYFVEGKAGWTTPEWNGYPTKTWDPYAHTHSYEAAVVAPTCTEKGYTTYICSCGDSYTANYMDALGHNFKDGSCTRCGEADPNYKPNDETDTPDAPTAEFNDVPDGAWYREAVDYAVSNKLMNGTGNNEFEPESPMTRAMLVMVLWRYAGAPEEEMSDFTDVKDDAWYAKAVAWAAENGIVGGVGNNKFDPNGNITREQMAAILFRYAQKLGLDTSARADLSGFPDGGKVSAYANDAIRWAVAEGLINGSDGKLLPQGNATRAQVAAILMRFIENVVS